jgi:hypothetical protein
VGAYGKNSTFRAAGRVDRLRVAIDPVKTCGRE